MTQLSLDQRLKKTSEELYPWVATVYDGQVKPEAKRALDAYVAVRIEQALAGSRPTAPEPSEAHGPYEGPEIEQAATDVVVAYLTGQFGKIIHPQGITALERVRAALRGGSHQPSSTKEEI